MDYPVENIIKLSQIALKSKFFGDMPLEKIAMIGIVAHDLNIPLSTALMGGITIISGKPVLTARVMNMLIRRAGHSISVEHRPDSCIIKGKRKDNGNEAIVSFTVKEAEVAGLLSKDVWRKFLPDMLFARALTRIGRQLFPDCIEGAYIEGEIDNNQSSSIVDVTLQQNNSDINIHQTEILDDPEPLPEEPLISEDQLQIVNTKADLLPKDAVEKILKAKGWESFAEMKAKQFGACMLFLEGEVRKELEKELSATAPWEDRK